MHARRCVYASYSKEAIDAMTNPFTFLQQTRSEVAKVIWPSRREVLVTSAMVFVMAVIFAIFFFGVDWVIRNTLDFVLTYFG